MHSGKAKNKEKHFITSEIELDENDSVLPCSIEAVMIKRLLPIPFYPVLL